MNRFFDFSPVQLKVLAVLTLTAALMGLYLLIHAYAMPDEVTAQQIFTGKDRAVFVPPFTVDPNTSPADSLELLPCIGPVLAERITAYRQDFRFEREVDIMNVSGIGPRTYDCIKDYLQVKHP